MGAHLPTSEMARWLEFIEAGLTRLSSDGADEESVLVMARDQVRNACELAGIDAENAQRTVASVVVKRDGIDSFSVRWAVFAAPVHVQMDGEVDGC